MKPRINRESCLAENHRSQWLISAERTHLIKASPMDPPSSYSKAIMYILTAMKQSRDEDQSLVARGLEPKEIATLMSAMYGVTYTPEDIGPRCWQMQKDGKLLKIEGTPRYDLPEAPR